MREVEVDLEVKPLKDSGPRSVVPTVTAHEVPLGRAMTRNLTSTTRLLLDLTGLVLTEGARH